MRKVTPHMNINEINLSDATVIRLDLSSESLTLYYEDWQEVEQRLVFADVVSVQAFSPEGTEMSEVHESTGDSFLDQTSDVIGEDCSKYRCFSFISAWNGNVFLKIVAQRFE